MITVFYGSQVHEMYLSWKELWMHILVGDPLYQEGICYSSIDSHWFTCDAAPMLIDDVPKQLLMLALVLDL